MPGMRPSSDRPINDPLTRMGFVRHPSIDGDLERIVVAFPGYGLQPAETPEPTEQAARARSTWHQEAGVWNTRAPIAARASISLRKVWQFDPGNSYWRMRMHPGGRYVAVAREQGVSIKILDWDAEVVTDTETLASNIHDIAFSPDGLWLAAAWFSSPHVKVWPFDPDTGLIGTAIADPATAAPSAAGPTKGCIRWHPSGMAIFQTTSTAADLVTGWTFTGGAFGANLPAIPNVSSWGVIGNETHWLSDLLGIWTPPSASLNSIDGMDVSPVDGSIVVAWTDSESGHFFSSLPNAIDETFAPTDFGWGMRFDSDPHGTGPSPYVPKHPVISPDGTLIAAHPNNNSAPGSGNDVLGEALVSQFGIRNFGQPRSFPRVGKLRRKWTQGPYGNRDLLAWRPGRATQQLMVAVAPNIGADLPFAEPRLLLWRMEGDRFAAHSMYETDIPDDFDWGALTADSSACWTPDGNTYLAIPEQYNAFGQDCLLVFDVRGDP